MYVREDGKVYITDENGTSYALSFKALMGFIYWTYNEYDTADITNGNVKFANAVSKFLEDSATDYYRTELY